MKKFIYVLIVLVFVGCENFLEPSVDQSKPTETAVNNIDDLNALILGVHDDLNNTDLFGRDIIAAAEAMSDNAFSNQNSGRFIDESRLDFTVNDGFVEDLWAVFYEAIATSNIAIEANLESSDEVDFAKGQAYALRAFSHMNLMLHFGQQFTGGTLGIPYITAYNDGNIIPERNTIQDVWNAIEQDFSTAITLMSGNKEVGNPIYINYFATRGLQSRFYLYNGNFDEAIVAADDVIMNSGLSLVNSASLVSAWGAGTGPNSLFELSMTSNDNPGFNSLARIYKETNYGDLEATQDLYNSYAPGDARLLLFNVNGDTVRITGKYVDDIQATDNVRVIRFAEVLLNKAEALARRAQGSDLTDAIAIINNLSSERGSSTVYASITQQDVINDVLNERRLELAMEGHRFYDLARNGKDLPYLNLPTRGINYITESSILFGNYRFALPIPQSELDANSSMIQNTGYD